ncbi:MAG: hypothetical protein HYS40_06505 [Gemmatimonadetes bacterium]|nr:hypothetical protein [Gemmatimonadota bacterium]
MTSRRVALTIVWIVACGVRGGIPGLAPDAEPARPPSAHAGGRFEGAALGWTLGSEVHLFVADSDFARQVYRRVLRPGLAGDAPAGLDSAFGARHVLSLSADRIPARRRDPGYFDATVLHRGGAVPVALELIRLHRPGDCSAPGAVTELVYSFPQAALPAVPPSHSAVAGLFRAPAFLRSGAAPRPALDRDAARRLAARAAEAAEHLTAMSAAPRATPLTRRLALDADLAADAADVLSLLNPARSAAPYAVAVRARFREPDGDTVFVSAVVLTDTALTRPHWVMRPVRARLVGGLLEDGVRYVLRGVVIHPPSERELLLVDRIADVEAEQARALAIDPWARRVVAAQPLALRCR